MTLNRLRTPALTALFCVAAATGALAGNVTYNADNLRTGWYPQEGFITPAIVSSAAFGQRWNTPIDGQVYAQPLYANGQVLVATETNWVYSLDADTGAVLWKKQFGEPWKASDIGCGDLTPTIGVTATPVIDDDAGLIYIVNKQYETGTSGPAAFFLHKLDLVTGAELAGFPVKLQGSAQNAPAQAFDAFHHHNRASLLLLDGVIYVPFGAHCDIGPWQGWIFGVTTAGQIKAIWTGRAQVNASGAAIWQSGDGLVSDGTGRIFFSTGNGGGPTGTTAIPGTSPPANCGECTMRVEVQANGTLAAKDFFAPKNAVRLDQLDQDLGSGGPAALPSAYFGTSSVPNLLVQSGKEGYVYLQNRDALGGYRTAAGGNDTYVQRLGAYAGVWSKPSVWPGDGGYVYINGNGGVLRALKYGVVSNTPTLTNTANSIDGFGFSSSPPIITADGTTNGSALIWVISVPDGSGNGAELWCYDALPTGVTLNRRYRTPIGQSAKFTPPGAGRGLIYVGTRDGHLIAFGAPAAQLTVTKTPTAVHLDWSNNAAPYTLRRAEDVKFTQNKTTLVDHQPATSFDDGVLADGLTHFYLVN